MEASARWPAEGRIPSDEELVRQHLAGQVHAFDELYLRHARAVRATCAEVLDSDADLEALVLEIFGALVRRLEIAPVADLGAWLERVAHQRAVGIRDALLP